MFTILREFIGIKERICDFYSSTSVGERHLAYLPGVGAAKIELHLLVWQSFYNQPLNDLPFTPLVFLIHFVIPRILYYQSLAVRDYLPLIFD